jgi:hypothetical protein
MSRHDVPCIDGRWTASSSQERIEVTSAASAGKSLAA